MGVGVGLGVVMTSLVMLVAVILIKVLVVKYTRKKGNGKSNGERLLWFFLIFMSHVVGIGSEVRVTAEEGMQSNLAYEQHKPLPHHSHKNFPPIYEHVQ